MTDTVIVDSDVLIEAWRDIGDAVACLEHVEGQAHWRLALSAKWNSLSFVTTKRNFASSTDSSRAFR